ncbi:MAG: hypothetical protein H6981_00810 [Gammaproteobacteria bacterium]|nr:hypothetical protein [Gammaproteobacteria bacterium]MCP5135328.1 hypothetical protein [Gammaproteobacteria bacterium]
MSEHDERISRLYHTRDGASPSALSDAFVKRAAHAAVKPKRPALRWAAPLAMAATVLLSLGVLLRVGIERSPAPGVDIMSAPVMAPAPAPQIVSPEADESARRFQTERAVRERMVHERRSEGLKQKTAPAPKPATLAAPESVLRMELEDVRVAELMSLEMSDLLSTLEGADPALWERVIEALERAGRTRDSARVRQQMYQDTLRKSAR